MNIPTKAQATKGLRDHGYFWKHATQISPIPDAERTGIAVFDDEEGGFVHLYVTDGARFSPGRSVCTKSIEYFNSVLSAWAIGTEWVDLRADKTVPLPAALRS